MNIINQNPVIKSVRIFEEDGSLKLDCRTKPNVKLPKGKVGNRFRFSTGIQATSSALKSIEKNKFDLAQEHYESLFQTLENKEIVLFEDIAHLALKEAEADRGKLDSTKDYQNILKLDVLPFFSKMLLKEIKVKDIKAWVTEIAEQKLSQSRFNKKYYVVKRVLDYACENEFIESNPISFVKRSSKLFAKPKDKSTEYFSKEERNIILNDTCENGTVKDKLDHPFINTFMHVALLTGARTGEIMALKLEDIDFENNTITIQRSIRKGVESGTKTGKTRVVPMIKTLKEALLKWIGTSQRIYLFPKPYTDSPYSDSRTIVDKYYKPLLKRLKIKYRVLYNTRHSFASVAVENKIPISTVSKCLGHSVLSTTERFYLQFGNANQDDIRDQLENLTA
jgi:integrase